MSRSSSRTDKALGYQSVGMKPIASCGKGKAMPGFVSAAESKTATAFNEESATNTRVPSGDCASAVG
jgi:hypothetical protein